MGAEALLLAFVAGAAAIALWADTRLGRHAPESLMRALVHVFVATVLLELLLPVAGKLLSVQSRVAVLAGLFGIAFPALTYVLLTVLWTLKAAIRTLGGTIR